MKILCLYGNDCALELFDWIEKKGHVIMHQKDRLDGFRLTEMHYDMIVSYTYPYIIKKEIIDAFGNNIVNIHTSFLPYNRGAYPNLFSIMDGTPRGVTLHYINAGIDEGDIIAQELVPLKPGATLKSSYDELDTAAKNVFMRAFEYYEYWDMLRKKPMGGGTVHKEAEFLKIKEKFGEWDWNMEVAEFLRVLGR